MESVASRTLFTSYSVKETDKGQSMLLKVCQTISFVS